MIHNDTLIKIVNLFNEIKVILFINFVFSYRKVGMHPKRVLLILTLYLLFHRPYNTKRYLLSLHMTHNDHHG